MRRRVKQLRTSEFNATAIGAARAARGQHFASNRPLGDDPDDLAKEEAGVKGEEAFARAAHLSLEPIADVEREAGINLRLPDGRSVNVVTSRKRPTWLPVEVGNLKADLYVLAHWKDGMKHARLIGWATRSEVERYSEIGKLEFTKHAPENYKLHIGYLHPIDTLLAQCNPNQLSLF